MIRGIDFYQYCYKYLQEHSAFDIVYEPVNGISNEGGKAVVKTTHNNWKADYLFNSIPFRKTEWSEGIFHMLQHFKGWIIETSGHVFNTAEATLMDFRTPQNQGTTFLYIMPLSPQQALVEYTIFSESVLPDAEYEAGLRSYLKEQCGLSEYKILETETGVIPMTNFRFTEADGRIIHIGTAGGQTNPSTGYTFRNIQEKVSAIVTSLEQYGHPYVRNKAGSDRFLWYDSILLNILSNKKLEGRYIFSELFKKNSPQKILRFLDNGTSLSEEFKLLNSLPQWPFMKAGIEEIIKSIRRKVS